MVTDPDAFRKVKLPFLFLLLFVNLVKLQYGTFQLFGVLFMNKFILLYITRTKLLTNI